MRSKEPTKEDTLNALLKRLNDKRNSSGRPEELEVLEPFLFNKCFCRHALNDVYKKLDHFLSVIVISVLSMINSMLMKAVFSSIVC